MANYHKGVIPNGLPGSLRDLLLQRERFLRTLNEPNQVDQKLDDPEASKPLPTKASDWYRAPIQQYTDPGTISDLPIPPAGSALVLRFTSTPTLTSGTGLKLSGDFTPANTDSTLSLLSDGQALRETGRSSDSISTLGTLQCPVLITGDCTNALRVQTASAVQDFNVDTSARRITVGSQTMLVIGQPPASGTFGFYDWHQGNFEIQSSAGPNTPVLHINRIDRDGMAIFGSDDWTIAVHANVFANSVAFLGGFAWDRKTKAASYLMTPYDMYIGFTGPTGHTITLPPTTTGTGAGAKPGTVCIVKDLANLVFPDSLTVTGDGADTIDGQANVPLREGNALFLMTDGINWGTIV